MHSVAAIEDHRAKVKHYWMETAKFKDNEVKKWRLLFFDA